MKILLFKFKTCIFLLFTFFLANCQGDGLDGSNFLNEDLVQKAEIQRISKAIPGQPYINWMDDIQTGEFDIQWTMWWGINGSSAALYENGIKIDESALLAKGYASQGGSFKLKSKGPGLYEYKIALCNGLRCNYSFKKVIEVTSNKQSSLNKESPGMPVIAWMKKSISGDFKLEWNMWWGINGSRYELWESGRKLKTKSINENTPYAQSGSFRMSGYPAGKYDFSIKLCNSSGCKESEIKRIEVLEQVNNNPKAKADLSDKAEDSKPQNTNSVSGSPSSSSAKLPGTPVIAWMPAKATSNFKLHWNMWWGENGNEIKLFENRKEIDIESLVLNSPAAQNGFFDLKNKKDGQYQYYVSLCNAAGCSNSAPKTIIVGIKASASSVSGGTQQNQGNQTPASAGTSQGQPSGQAPLLPVAGKSFDNKAKKLVVGYFPEWGIYGRNYHISDVPAQNLTHMLYAFGKINSSDELEIWDTYAALEKSYPGDVWDQDYKGTFNQMRRLKKLYPDLKILYSIGGWTGSSEFYSMASTASRRKVFIDSVLSFLDKYEFFDGVDLDWEYPVKGGLNPALASPSDKANFTALIKELRAALDNAAALKAKTYQLTAAVSAAPSGIAGIDYAAVNKHMDYVFIMSYDFHGAWENLTGHHTPLYFDNDIPGYEGYSTDDSVKNIIKAGFDREKIVIGVAFYGRSWRGVAKNSFSDLAGASRELMYPVYGLASGGGPCSWGSWDNGGANCGVLDYKDIAANYGASAGFNYFFSSKAVAAYLWNSNKEIFISYDSPDTIKRKAEYVLDYNGKGKDLAGIMFWELSADNGDLLNAIHKGYGNPEK